MSGMNTGLKEKTSHSQVGIHFIRPERTASSPILTTITAFGSFKFVENKLRGRSINWSSRDRT